MVYINELYYLNATLLFAFASSICATIIGYKHHKKFPELKIFYFYPLLSFLQTLICYIGIMLKADPKRLNEVAFVGANIFVLAEFLLIYNFYSQIFKSGIIKKILRLITLIFVVTLILYWTWGNAFFIFPAPIIIIEIGCMLFPGFLYFLRLFKNPVKYNLLHEPSFWISVGIFFYFSCSLPIFFLKDFMFDDYGDVTESNLYSINYICYGILFLSITKAYLCPRRDTP